jgi:hypothetical protein
MAIMGLDFLEVREQVVPESRYVHATKKDVLINSGRKDMKRICRSLALAIFIYLFTYASLSLAQPQRVSINGAVTYKGDPGNALVIANGQFMFTGSAGYYDLEVPLDANGQITLYCFASKLAPFKEVLTPDGDVTTRDIEMVLSDSTRLPVVQILEKEPSDYPNRRLISGVVTYNEEYVSSLVLANGQNMFTSVSDGLFELDIPLDASGNITFYCFISGFSPLKVVFDPDTLSALIVLDPVVLPMHQILLGEWTFEYTINPTYEKTYTLDRIIRAPADSGLPVYVLGSDESGNDVRSYNVPGTPLYVLADYARVSELIIDLYQFIFITEDLVFGDYFEFYADTEEYGEFYPMTGSRISGP